jgi:diguanylate cyclase (GGDEF)-like protein
VDTSIRKLSKEELARLAAVRFDEYRRVTRWVVIAFSVLVMVLWAWDWSFDPASASNTLSLRIAGSVALLIPIISMNRKFGITASGVVLYGVILFIMVIYTLILGLMHNGFVIGLGGYLYIFLGSVLLGLPFSFTLNAVGTAIVTFAPHVIGALIRPEFPHALYMTLIWPAGFICVFFHWAAGKMILERLHYRAEIETLAMEDPLTGLLNRRALRHDYIRARGLAARGNAQLSLIMLDVDHFKSINDLYGHAAGDVVLRELANIMKKTFRTSDSLARIGGEEFVCLMPATALDEAVATGERLRNAVELARIGINDKNDTKLSFTVSIGVTEADPMENLEHLLDRADQAMYLAKSGGRNRLVHVP